MTLTRTRAVSDNVGVSAMPDADALFAEALRLHEQRDTAGSIARTRAALERDPDHVRALEHLGTLLVTRRRRYREGLEALERAAALRPADPGLWYALGWNCEFAAHEIRRRRGADDPEPDNLYMRAAEAFRRCLALEPDGKLRGDAEDLLDHVENELAQH